MKCTSGETGC